MKMLQGVSLVALTIIEKITEKGLVPYIIKQGEVNICVEYVE